MREIRGRREVREGKEEERKYKGRELREIRKFKKKREPEGRSNCVTGREERDSKLMQLLR